MTDNDFAALIYCCVFNVPNDDGDAYTKGIMSAIDTLSSQERVALESYYRHGMTYKQTGKMLGGVSGESARQIVIKACLKLRHRSGMRNMSVSAIVRYWSGLLKSATATIDELYGQIEILRQGGSVEPKLIVKLDPGKKSISEIGLSPRAYNCLLNVRVNTVDALLSLDSLDVLMKCRNFGRKSRDEIISAMREQGYKEWADKMDAE